jgi:hypothetical protein
MEFRWRHGGMVKIRFPDEGKRVASFSDATRLDPGQIRSDLQKG